MILIYITTSSQESAKNIAHYLLGKKLIACANIVPVHSMYLDNGIAEEAEAVLIAKTRESYFEKVKKEVEHIHPYNTPCILKISVKANKKYEDWLNTQLK